MYKVMIQYPTKKKLYEAKRVQTGFADRGMHLEDDLNKTNAYYLELDIANIHKKPTPITIVKVDYPARSKAKITEAYFKVPSTTDYNGIFKRYHIDFEAKETQSLTSFALSNLHQHQIEHMMRIKKQGGISFLILRFVKKDETYLIMIDDLLEFVKIQKRKSLPYLWVKENGHLIPYKINPPVDYLQVINTLLNQGVFNEKV